MSAANDNIDPNTPIRLKDIIAIAFPHGGMSVSSLRLESRRGRLTIIRLAGKDFTTLAHIEEMKSRCHVAANQPASGSGQHRKIAEPYGSSLKAGSNLELDAVMMIVDRLRKR